MTTKLLILLLSFGVSACMSHAQVQPLSTGMFDSHYNGVIAQLVDGASWKTIVTLVNLDTTPATYTLKFFADNGTPMVVQTTAGTGSSISGTLPPSGSQVIETNGGSATLSQGWALLETASIIGGSAIVRLTIAGQPDYEASHPILTYVQGKRFALPFDETTSSTGIAIVNPLDFTGLRVDVTFRGEDGTVFSTDWFMLTPMQHTAFPLASRYSQAIGKRGVVEFATSQLTFCMMGLRFGPQSFTSIIPLRSINWVD